MAAGDVQADDDERHGLAAAAGVGKVRDRQHLAVDKRVDADGNAEEVGQRAGHRLL